MKTFLVMIIILAFSYGIFMHVLLYPAQSPNWLIVFNVIFRPYLLLFGDMGLNSYNSKYSFLLGSTLRARLFEMVFCFVFLGSYVLISNQNFDSKSKKSKIE